MTQAEFYDRIVACFGFTPTGDQQAAIALFGRFLADRSPNVVMIMRGSAGTGKTSLASAMVDTMHRLGQHLVLMAPTGRAAKVLAVNSHLPAATIHRTIYRERSAGVDSRFNLNFNRYKNTLFVVDEASMIGGRSTADSNFGSGNLLDDLIRYVYGGDNCRMLLIGDQAQLPPVGEEEAPALSGSELMSHGLNVYECDLNEVVRQRSESGILYNATAVRRMAPSLDQQVAEAVLPKLRLRGFADVVRVPGNELVERLATSYSRVGIDETIVVTRSNKRANIYNQGIRAQVLDCDDMLCGSDRVMVVKNKYLKPEPSAAGTVAPLPASTSTSTAYAAMQSAIAGKVKALQDNMRMQTNAHQPANVRQLTFIANGDRCIIQRVRHFREFYGFHFADATLRFPDYDDQELQTMVLLDTLSSEAPSLTHDQQTKLFNNVMEDYQDLPLKADRLRAVRDDPYFNALQIKFAYAVTCHKAQGGQWEHVYVDQGYMTDDMLTPDYFHWLYTAITRARTCLFLVNWPPTQVEGGVED